LCAIAIAALERVRHDATVEALQKAGETARADVLFVQ
jgi:hypothetical protein